MGKLRSGISIGIVGLVSVLTLAGCERGTVTHVRDGDTIEVDGQAVRFIGIDTPESGQCGYDRATSFMTALVNGKTVTLIPDAKESDTDKYGRLLRFVFVRGGDGKPVDVGAVMLLFGLARARYDSLDGYPRHINQDRYRAIDAAVPDPCSAPGPTATAPPPTTVAPSSVYYANCTAARAAGAAPIYRGQPGYRSALDRDKDGIACE